MTKAKLREKLRNDPDLLAQFRFEIEERTAIMIYDGNVPETEAGALAQEDVLNNWLRVDNP